MTRNFRNFLFFLVGLIGSMLALSPYARAETIEATSSGNYWHSSTWMNTAPAYAVNTKSYDEALTDACIKWGNVNGFTFSHTLTTEPSTGSPVNGRCHLIRNSDGAVSTTQNHSLTRGSIRYTCPENQNWTLSGTSCTRPDCVPPEYRNASGQCSTTCPVGQTMTSLGCKNCTEIGGGTGNDYHYAPLPSGGACIGAPGSTGCVVPTIGTTVCMSGKCYGGLGQGTGQNCVVPLDGSPATDENQPGEAEPKPETQENCLAQGKQSGTVNGVTVCYSPDKTTPITTEKIITEKDANGVVTQYKQTTTCTGSNCTTTKTPLNPATGEPTGPGTEKSDSKNTGKFVGSGTGESEEDLNDVLRACNEQPDLPICRDYCSKPENAGKAACADLGEPEGDQDLQTKEMGVSSVEIVSFGGSGACPSSVSLPHGAVFRFDMICDFASMVKPIFIAFAWLAAGMIIMGAVRTNG